MRSFLSATFLALGLVANVVADEKLAKAKNCFSCHSIENKTLGPAFASIAARYATDGEAAEHLAVKVIKGGAGAWGTDVMPANTQVNEVEAKKLVAWILSLK